MNGWMQCLEKASSLEESKSLTLMLYLDAFRQPRKMDLDELIAGLERIQNKGLIRIASIVGTERSIMNGSVNRFELDKRCRKLANSLNA
jgi:hypothetical protein